MQKTERLDEHDLAELKLLALFNLETMHEGIKVHHSAGDDAIAAMARLHAKGLVSEVDGGYLTDLGVTAAEHLQAVLTVLHTEPVG